MAQQGHQTEAGKMTLFSLIHVALFKTSAISILEALKPLHKKVLIGLDFLEETFSFCDYRIMVLAGCSSRFEYAHRNF